MARASRDPEARRVERCPECGGELIDLGICLYCPEHGAFTDNLERMEVDENLKALIEASMDSLAVYKAFASRLKPMLEEKAGLLIKRSKWDVHIGEGPSGFEIHASRVGISTTRPGLWGVPMLFYLYTAWVPMPVALEMLKTLQDEVFKGYGRQENAANLVILFAPAIEEEVARYCAQQKTCKRLAQQGLNQIGFVVVGPDGRVISEVSGRLRGYVKHHFPEAYKLLSEMGMG